MVCVVSSKIRAEASSYPPDGLCDLLFFESFYKDKRNILAEGFRRLQPNALFFLDQAQIARRTKYGACFAFPTNGSAADFMTLQFDVGNSCDHAVQHSPVWIPQLEP
ncbi:hypothetical protein MRX96_052271 [Rhipicephalus microplus]